METTPKIIVIEEQGLRAMLKEIVNECILEHLKIQKQQPKPEHEFLKLPEAAELMRVAKSTIYKWVSLGGLRHSKRGKTLLFRKSDLLAYIEDKGTRKDKEEVAEAKMIEANGDAGYIIPKYWQVAWTKKSAEGWLPYQIAEHYNTDVAKVNWFLSQEATRHYNSAYKVALYMKLPKEFTTDDGKGIAAKHSISERSFQRMLNDAVAFEKLAHGKYRKKLAAA